MHSLRLNRFNKLESVSNVELIILRHPENLTTAYPSLETVGQRYLSNVAVGYDKDPFGATMDLLNHLKQKDYGIYLSRILCKIQAKEISYLIWVPNISSKKCLQRGQQLWST